PRAAPTDAAAAGMALPVGPTARCSRRTPSATRRSRSCPRAAPPTLTSPGSLRHPRLEEAPASAVFYTVGTRSPGRADGDFMEDAAAFRAQRPPLTCFLGAVLSGPCDASLPLASSAHSVGPSSVPVQRLWPPREAPPHFP